MNYVSRPLPPRGSARRPPPVAPQASAPPQAAAKTAPALPPPAQPPNIQVAFLSGLLGKAVVVESLDGGAERVGVLKRFDVYTLILEVGGREVLCFKHSVSAVTEAP